MRRRFYSGVAVGATAAAIVLVAGTAFAGTGVGAVFNLGRTNTVNATSTLTGGTAGKMLRVTNTSTGSGATGIGVTVASGKPPLVVNSTTKVTNLNADLVDGKNAADFVASSTVRRMGPIGLTACDCTDATPLITIGQFTFLGACVSTAGQQVLHLEIKSSADHAAYADLTQSGAGGTYGNGNMTAGSRSLLASVIVQNQMSTIFTPVNGSALSADGRQVFYNLYMGQNLGTVTTGTCVFGGSFTIN